MKVLVYNRKLFFACLCENLFCLLQGNTFLGGDKVFRGHAFADFAAEVCFKF